MAKLEQKSIEQYFQEFKVSASAKEKMLPKITDIVYERNQHVIQYEAEKDEYRRQQILTEVEELGKKIAAIFRENQ